MPTGCSQYADWLTCLWLEGICCTLRGTVRPNFAVDAENQRQQRLKRDIEPYHRFFMVEGTRSRIDQTLVYSKQKSNPCLVKTLTIN